MVARSSICHCGLLFLLGFFCLLPHSRAYGRSAKSKSVKLVMIGDSVTLSSRNAAGSKLPECVGKELNQRAKEKPSWTVVNAGVGSETAEKCRARAKAVLDKEKPNVVTLAYGLNDTGKRNPEWFRENLLALIELVSKHPSKPLLVLITATPFDDKRHGWGKQASFIKAGGLDAYMDREINSVTRSLAVEKELPLCDLHRHFLDAPKPMDLLLGDGVHPNDEGNKLSATHIATALWSAYQTRVLKKSKAKKLEKKAKSSLRKLESDLKNVSPKKAEALRKKLRTIWEDCPHLPESVHMLDLLDHKMTPKPSD